MKLILKEIRKYALLYFLFAKNCLIAQMQFRTNFVFSILVELGWIFSHLLYLIVIYKTGVVINGLSRDAMLMFVGTYLFLTGIFMSMFFTNFDSIPEYIRSGTLDLFMTKPVSLQFIATLRYVNFGYPIPDLILGICMIAVGWAHSGITVNFINVAGFMAFTLSGVALIYSLQIIPSLCSFWMVNTRGIYTISYSVYDLNKMPMGIYNKWIRRVGTYILPLFPMANYPTLFVTNKLNSFEIIWGLVSPFFYLIAVKVIWDYSVKNYTSASS